MSVSQRGILSFYRKHSQLRQNDLAAAIQLRDFHKVCSVKEEQNVVETSKPDSRITPINKGLGAFEHPLETADLASLQWNLLREDLSLPTAVLYQEKILHNLHWMQQFITAYGVKLAPHGKTTMAPKLFDLQLQNGAWGITLATAHQVCVAY
jgi:hypothetical protein